MASVILCRRRLSPIESSRGQRGLVLGDKTGYAVALLDTSLIWKKMCRRRVYRWRLKRSPSSTPQPELFTRVRRLNESSGNTSVQWIPSFRIWFDAHR
jgi:hypothetical protein